MLTRQVIVIVLLIAIMGGARFFSKHGRNPKKHCHGRKPPLREKRQKLNRSQVQSEVEIEDVSVSSISQVVVEDASVDAISDGDDNDSCFSACKAWKKRNALYDGPVDCSLQGSDNVPVVDCTFLQHERGELNDRGNDSMNCESGDDDVMEDESDGLVDTETEDSEWMPDDDESESEDDEWLPDDNSLLDVDMEDSDDSSNSNDHFAFVLSNDCCNNCRRKCTQSADVRYEVRLRETRVQQRRFQRKFANYRWAEVVSVVRASGSGSRVHGEFVRLKLCRHCRDYLTSERSQNKADIVWPAMIWKWLSTESSVRQHRSRLWSLIPRLWRPWWLDSVHELHPCYTGVTLETPSCSFVDLTERRSEFQRALAMKEGGVLAAACDKHLHAIVWCPWGESEYLHLCGSLPLDLIVNRLYGDCMRTIKGNARDDLRKVVGILDDFLDGNFGKILENPEWEVRPTVVFENGAPVVLTCRKHRSGCKGQYLHLPRNPRGTLPSLQSDQLTPAVVRPRTVKQLKVHEFSDSYQMQRMQGQYNGVDTVRVCDHHNFAVDSKVLRDREEVSLTGRKDLRALVGEWGQCGILPPDVAESRIADASRYGPSMEEVEQCCKGATFVTLEDSLKLQKMNKSGRSRVVSVKEEGTWEKRHYVPPWPGCLVNVHPFNQYGASFPILPKMYDGLSDTRLVFYLAAMHANLPTIWDSSCDNVRIITDWEGWLLAYLGHKCFSSCYVKGKNSQFKFKDMSTQSGSLSELLLRIGLREDLRPSDDGASSASEDDGSATGNESVSTSSSYFGWNNVNGNGENLSVGWNDDGLSIDSDDSEDDLDEVVSIGSMSDASMGWASGAMEIELCTDGLFHPSDLKQLFQNHSDVNVGCIENLSTMLDDVDRDVNCMIVYRREETRTISPTDTRLTTELRCHNDDAWDLRFVGGCNASHTEDRFILARHGGSFPAWWRQNYWNTQSYDYYQEHWSENRVAIPCKGWDVAVYVRKRLVPLEECRDVILRSMGSQTSILCEEHAVPLITAPFSTNASCCLHESNETPCSKSITLRCPVEGCESAVCKTHEKVAIKTQRKIYVRARTSDSLPQAERIVRQQRRRGAGEVIEELENATVASETDTDSEWMPNENVDDNDDDNEFGFLSENTEDPFRMDDVSVGSNTEEDDRLCSDMRDNLLFDVTCDETSPVRDDNPDMQAYGESEIPIACDQEEPLTVRGDPSSISGCCILNNMGSLLVRRGSKLRGSMNQRFFLQRIVATTPGRAVPLVYPEAMLFPSLFWKDAGDDSAVLGAMPCGLLAHDSTLRKYGIASMQSHLYGRLTNPTLGTSNDPRYVCHAFDSMVNLGCRHEDVRVILHRGVTGTNDGVRVGDAGPGNISDKSFFNTDSVDGRPAVNQLAAAVENKQTTYFYTHTANDLNHFGLSKIKEWIESDAVMEILCDGTETVREREEVRLCLRQAASVPLLRNWVEACILYMNYVATSDEKPLGDVEHIWWRFEFQESVGNLPHVHALIWLKDGEPLEITYDRIRGSIMELIRPDEIDDLVAEGLLSCAEEVMDVQTLASRVLVHICSSRCKRRVGTKDGEVVCRTTDNERESPDPRVHATRTINVDHSNAAVKVLAEVGLFVLDEATQTFRPVVDVLTATKHYPPAHNSEGIISACNGRLFTLTRSNDNLKYVTGYLMSRYLARYLALVDENNRIYIGSMSRERNVVNLEKVVLHNTKITSSAIQEAKRDAARHDKKNPTGRAVSHMEMLCVLLGYDQVYTNFQFVHIPTVPLEERPAFDRKRPFTRLKEEGVVPEATTAERPQDLDAADVIPSYKVRNLELDNELPLWRQVGTVESLMLRDQCLAPQTVDAITLFGIRPPELRFVRRPRLYFRWFYRDTAGKKGSFKKALDVQREAANPKLMESYWVDGSDCRVYVRPFAVREILEYLNHGDPETNQRRSHASFYSQDMEDDGLIPTQGTCHETVSGEIGPLENPWNETTTLFRKLNARLENPPRISNSPFSRAADEWERIKARFIGPAGLGTAADAPIIWYNSIKPTQPGRWLIHILLSMGEFDCETNLLGHGNMVENFTRARLISEDTSHREDNVRDLTARYIVEQLVFLPGGARQFDRHVVAADRVLHQALIEGGLPLDEVPASLYTHIREQQDKKTRAHLLANRKFLAAVTLKDLGHAQMMSLPAKVDDVVDASISSPLKWKPDLVRTPAQSVESFEEQKAAIKLAMEQINKFQWETTTQTKGMLIIGGPGTGKTTCLQAIGLACMSRGLNTGLGTVMAERAKQLGGQHLSKWLLIPVNERATPGRLAELAIARLVRDPKQLALIRSLDVFLIDEFGQVSAETLAVLDIILRRIRGSTDFMGGVLVFATLDECQLRPVDGRPPLLSPHILTSFEFCGLDYSVRAARDPDLRRIIDITRMPKRLRTAAVRREFKRLVATKCTFVDNWDDPRLTMDILRMFAKHRARADAERRLLARMKVQYRGNILCVRSVDFESSTESNWVEARSATTRLISRKVKEPSRLYFYPHAVFQVTFTRDGQFSQSQLAVLAEMPSAEDICEFRPVLVYVAPEGMKAIPSGLSTESDFLNLGFQKRQIGTAPERSTYVGLGILGKRRQYGLRHRLAATIHAGMGQDLPALVTCVTGDSMYHLFQREQVVVLLSRTHFAKDIIFVGDCNKTAEALADMLDKDGPYSEYMEYLVRKLVHHSSERGPSVDLTTRHPYCAMNIEVPNDNSGFSYLLASVAKGAEGRVTYIGQTDNLVVRLKSHKLSAGPSATADPGLKPWAVLAYVSGFEGAGKPERMYFERLWQAARDRMNVKRRRQHMSPLTADEVADLGNELVVNCVYRRCPGLADKTLAFVRCGRFSSVH